jgi:hypothetical protein
VSKVRGCELVAIVPLVMAVLSNVAEPIVKETSIQLFVRFLLLEDSL